MTFSNGRIATLMGHTVKELQRIEISNINLKWTTRGKMASAETKRINFYS